MSMIGHLGGIIRHLGPILSCLEANLRPCWAHLGPPRRPRTLQKQRFSLGFFNILVIARSWRYHRLCEAISCLLGSIMGHLRDILEPRWGHSGANPGPSLGYLGPSWAFLCHLGAILGPLSAILGPSSATLGPSLRYLGPSWTRLGQLGPSLGHL